jgi:hypothetical protein
VYLGVRLMLASTDTAERLRRQAVQGAG